MLKNVLSPPSCLRSFKLRSLLTLLLLSVAPTVFGQSVIYGLVNVYRTTTAIPASSNNPAIPSYPKGTQTLVGINPATGSVFGAGNTSLPPVLSPISGITSGQILVGIDVRPRTNVLYGLGYDTLSGATQVYRLTPLIVSGTTDVVSGATAVAAGPAITLPLGNISPGATSKRIGFDFNPVANLIRVVSANGSNYRLDPDTGALVAADGRLNYVAGNTVSVPVPTQTGPASTAAATGTGIGSVAYTNSRAEAETTTLYDYDELDRGILSIQNPPNSGTLTNPIAGSFFITNSTSGQGPFIITPKLVALDIDFFYNRSTSSDTGYLLEVTADQLGGYHASNLYTLNVSNNLASLVGNIFSNPSASVINSLPQNPALGNLYSLDLIDIAAGVAAPLVWSGFVSDEWTNPQNWVPNRVPTSTDDVLIPGTYTPGSPLSTSTFPGTTPTPNQPVVRVAGQVANSVSLSTGASLTLATNGVLNVGTVVTNTGGSIIGNGGTLTVGGSFTNTNASSRLTLNSGTVFSLGGNFTNNGGTVGGSGTGRLALTGTSVQTIGGTLSTFPNLTVGTAGATTTAPVSILSTGGVTLNGNLAIGTSQAFTLLSDANGTAYVANNNSAVATGLATVQRYITPNLNAGLGYRHYSTPVSGNTVADFTTTGFTPTVNAAYNTSATPPSVTPFPNVFSYDQSRLGLTNTSPEFDKGFQSPAALTTPLTVGLGYTVNIASSQLVDFLGTLNTGNYSRTNLVRGTQATAGFQFVGNPYPSAIRFTDVYTASSGIENALYVYKSATQYTGTYASYINGVGTNGGSNIIPVAQAFFVRVRANTDGVVNFVNGVRLNAPDNTAFQRTAADSRPRLALTLRNAAIANQTSVYFEQGATSAFDDTFDAHYLPATHGLDLATEVNTGTLSINGQPALTSTATVPLVLHAATAGTYTLAVDELVNLPAGYHAYLRDALTSTYTDLATTPSISLTLAPADAAAGRYAVVFATASPLATASAATAQLVNLYPNPAHGITSLLLPQALRTGAATQVSIVDNLGRTVLSRTLSSTTDALELPIGNLRSGIYSVQAQTNAGVVAKRLVVE